MALTTTPATFIASVSAADAADATARVQKRLAGLAGFSLIGDPTIRSARHGLWNVTIGNDGTGDVNRAWVTLTSYGISPDERLGSHWSTVPGIGR